MSQKFNLKKFSFLVYGLGSTGKSVIKYFKDKNISNFYTWDDSNKLRKKYKNKNIANLNNIFEKVDYIILSPGISIKKNKYKDKLIKFKKKIISDIDLIYLDNKKFKSIVVTGTNGKSTTCKIITHLLKFNNFDVKIGGNIGTPVLKLKSKKNTYFVIEASSFQLAHSQFIHPDYAILLNISNDHLDWHGSVKNYTDSKFKIFNLQKKENFALINTKLKSYFKKKKYSSRLVPINIKSYNKVKIKIKNSYLKSSINNENMNFAYTLSKLLKVSDRRFINSMNNFTGLAHRYEIFLRKKNITFINDSKATSFEASKNALASNKNIYWILGGKQKDKDKLNLKNLKKNITKSYIIGKNSNFFEKQIKNKVNFCVTKHLKNAIIRALKDIKLSKSNKSILLLSPSAASYDQFKNFEIRGNEFKKLCKEHVKKYI